MTDMGRTLTRVLLIVVGGAGLGLAFNLVSPRPIPYLRPAPLPLPASDQVALMEAQELWEKGEAVFLDARSPGDYAAGHIAGALSLPVEMFEAAFPPLRGRMTQDLPVVIYCDGAHCDQSHRLLLKLRALGYSHVRVLVNGWTQWRRANLPARAGGEP
jgi:rhodanese-related sulfurtransferase